MKLFSRTKKQDKKKEGALEKGVAQKFTPSFVASTKEFSRILIAPLVTEKAMKLSESGTYVFKVLPGATKPSIKEAVQKMYKVHVTGVRVVTVRGKKVFLARQLGKSNDWRKAMITVQKGEVITF